MKIIKYQLSIINLLLLFACTPTPLLTYEDADCIFFKWAKPPDNLQEMVESSDFVKINMGYDTPLKDDSTVLVDVCTMGHISGQDRLISAEIMDISTAVVGPDIEILPSFIPAGKAEGKLAVKLKNSEQLTETTLWARIRLVPNEHFHTNYTQAYTNGSINKEKTGLEYNIFFDAKVDMPSLWADPSAGVMLTTYFGTYSNVKLLIICTVCALSRTYFMHNPGAENATTVLNARFSTSIVMGMISQVNRYLKQYEQEHGESLRDENGNKISMGTNIDRD